MNNNKFLSLKNHFGLAFLKYLLNKNDDIDRSLSFDKLNFSEDQITTLDELYHIYKNTRLDLTNADLHSDRMLHSALINHYEVYNTLRAKCGGTFPKIKEKDAVLRFLYELAIKVYPILLINPAVIAPYFIGDSSPHCLSKELLSQMNDVCGLFKQDELLGKLINDKDGLECSLCFNSDIEGSVCCQVITFVYSLIMRSFRNACFRMNYSLDSCLNEIRVGIEGLRLLAKKGQASFPVFIGIKGLCINRKLQLSNNVVIYPVGDVLNPCPYIKEIITVYSGDKKSKLSGCILEVMTNIRLINQGKQAIKSTSYDDINYVVERLQLSIVLAQDTYQTNMGFDRAFLEEGFPWKPAGNRVSHMARCRKNFQFNESHEELVIHYFKVLGLADIQSKFRIPLRRLRRAVYERYIDNSEDSFLDAMICLDGLFGESGANRFKISVCIAKFLEKDPGERKKLHKSANDLYDDRSGLLHGGKIKNKKKDVGNVSIMAINIAVRCFSKLLQDEDLLKLNKSDLINRLLLSDV